MRARTRSSVTAMIVIGVLMMGAIAQAAPIQGRPFQERLEASFVSIDMPALERCSEPALLLHYAGEGTMSHLGRVTFQSSHCSYLDEDWVDVTGEYGEAEMVIVASSGDQLWATYEGQQIGDTTTYIETMTITGGTGRFEGASGLVREIVTVDSATFNVSIRGDGSISY